jgi:hypothetical protein
MFKIPVILSLLFLLLINFSGIYAQIKGQEYRPLSCGFTKSEEVVGEGGTISNVLFVKNVNGITREFYLEITVPNGWKTLNSSNKVYKLDPNDSMFIPVRIIPNKKLMKGSTRYNINVLVVGTDGRAHAICSFFAGKPKRTDWEMSILPRSRIYFLNGQSRVPLSLYVANKGEEEQQLNISWSYLGRGISLSPDSSANKSFLDLKLKEDTDTIIDFSADIARPDYNFSKVDLETYNPFSDLQARKYRLYLKAVEPFYRKEKGVMNKTPFGFEEGKENVYRPSSGGESKSVNADLIKLNSAVDFVKLSNTASINNYGSGVFPVIWYSNLFNVLGMQPMWGNNFISRFSPRKDAMLYSNLQHFFTFYSPTKATYQNLVGNAFYSSPKFDVYVGQGPGFIGTMAFGGAASGGSAGSGFSLGYRPYKGLSLSTLYAQGPRLFSLNPTTRTVGAAVSYAFPSNRLITTISYRFTDNTQILSEQNILAGGFRYKINANHNVLASGNVLFLRDSVGTTSQSNRQGYNFMLNYGGIFFKGRLSQMIMANVNNNPVRPNQISQFINIGGATTLNNRNWRLNFSSAFNRSINGFNNVNQTITQIPSNLSFWFKNRYNFNAFPVLFHNYITDNNFQFHNVGLALGGSHFNYNKNFRISANFRGGYNFLTDSISYAPIFNANFFTSLGYRTISANIGYNYGPMDFIGVRQFNKSPSIYPQYLFLSINKQHIFRKIRQFVFDFSLNYSWNNVTYAHNLALAPVIYFFTKKGWRFNASVFYNLNARDPEQSRQFYSYQGTSIPLPDVQPGVEFSNNFNLQFGVRKEFGILLPKKWRKNFYSNPTFIAFLDFNGNRVKDKDEVALENMVVQLNGHEAITDKDGKCQFLNVEQKRYFFNVIPLTDIDGWFSLRKDSVDITPSGVYYVPFSKGVKIEGTVLLDREKFTEDILGELDLSKIRIFTTDTSGNTYSTLTDRQGNFSFYIPFGYYALSMDESVVSDRFIIAQNNIPLELEEGIESYYQAFFIIEKRRRVKKKKFNEKGELVYVEEVENNEGRPNKNRKAKDANEELGVFNETRRNGGVKKDSTEVWRMNYEELDKRIQRLDSIINELKDKSVQGNTNNNNSQGFNQVVLMDALKKLKDEEERNTPYFIVQVATVPKGQTIPADIMDKYNSGSLKTLDDSANTIYYFGSKFTDVDKAVDAVGVAAKNKIGKPELKVQFKGKVMTLNEYKDANR